MTSIPLTLQATAEALRSGKITSLELTKEMLRKIYALNPVVGAYITVTEESALAEAAAADAKFAAGVDVGQLQGIPYCTKDIIATKDAPTTANSVVMDREWGAGWDAPVVTRLRSAGAVHLGKTVLSEYACGLPDPAKPFPIPRNPWGLDRSAAGSSSGTGVAISAGLALMGLGTDTGGSIRGPGSHNGHSAMKATYGRVPKAGCVPIGYSLDNIGPHARSAWDCAAMLKVIAGWDPTDPCSAKEPVDDYTAALDGNVAGLRIGIPTDYFFENPGPEPETKAAVMAVLAALKSAGAVIVEVDLPHSAEAKEANTITWQVEGFAYHAQDLAFRKPDYGKFTSMTLMRGALYMGSDYVQAQRFRTYWQKKVAEVMQAVDVLITPTSVGPAPILSSMDSTSTLGPGFTGPWNLVGTPAIAIPCGFSSDSHMPLSAQVIGKPFAESTVFKVADAFQRLTDWHLQVPPIAAEVMA
ncbi:MAG: amidase [Tepidiformaceae bacterium]